MKSMIIPNNILESRKKVWIALAEFYLDNALTSVDYQRLETTFKSSKLDLKEIKDIDLYEVRPSLYPNLFSPAGIWSQFDEGWLINKCESNFKKKNRLTHILRCRILSIFIKNNYDHHWKNLINYKK